MSLTQTSQRIFSVKVEIAHKTRELIELTRWKNYQIAEILGVEPETISRGRSGKTNSPALLAGLKLLLELETLKRKLASQRPIEERFAEFQAELAALSSARVDVAENVGYAWANESNVAPSPPPVQNAPPAPPVRYRKAKRKGPPTPPASSHEA